MLSKILYRVELSKTSDREGYDVSSKVRIEADMIGREEGIFDQSGNSL